MLHQLPGEVRTLGTPSRPVSITNALPVIPTVGSPFARSST